MKTILSVILGASLATSAAAQQKESFEEYVAGLKQEARAKGISEQILTEAFAGVEYKPRAVKADRNQPEKKLTLDEYIPRAVPDWKVKQAKELHDKHYAELKRIGDEYGVQPRFIVALWGWKVTLAASRGITASLMRCRPWLTKGDAKPSSAVKPLPL